MDSGEVESNSGFSQAPSGGHGGVSQLVYSSVWYYMNRTIYRQV